MGLDWTQFSWTYKKYIGIYGIAATTLEGKTWEAPGTIGSTTPNTGAFTTLAASGQFTSTVGIGTAPYVVTSTTRVANLNVATAGSADGSSTLEGKTWEVPGTIGSTTPNTGAFTTLGASGTVTLTATAPQLILRDTATTATAKVTDVVATAYTSANQPFNLLHGFTNSTDNYVTIGGGSGTFNAATRVQIYAAAGVNTVTGTLVGEWLSTGLTVTGALTSSTGFGCNGNAAQTKAVSGGTLGGVITALVANGILSS